MRISFLGVLFALAFPSVAQQELTVESIDFWKQVADTFSYFNHQDSARTTYELRPSFKKPSTWIEAEKEYRFYNSMDTLGFSLNKVLALLDSAKNFWDLCAAKTWCFAHPYEVFPHLICRLSNKTKVGLTNTAD